MAGGGTWRAGAVGLLLSVGIAGAVAPARSVVIDDFERSPEELAVAPEGWSAAVSEGARVDLSVEAGPDGRALRVDFDLGGGVGWVIAR
ncbi:MAG TPA: hypothetical protein VLC53_19195 [Myxococcota bacterium]|nr:hypothetical protein [Myxococcota bacterium]